MEFKIVRIFSFLAIFIFFLAFGFGENNSAFDEVCKNISSQKITKGSFKQTKTIRKISRDIKSSGTFIIADGDGILWETQKPFLSAMIIKKSGIEQINSKGKKTIVSSNNNEVFSNFSSLMTSLFKGDVETLKKNFDIKFFGTTEKWNINLVPKGNTVKKVIESIEMQGNKTIDSMVLNEPSGDFTKYEYSNQTFPEALSAEEKKFFEN